ncbi:hypothetical protein GCM10009804_45260 [Kribbella hippodromi]|uniref:Uncharacterized protein n=1 Tax=Kribbella hippodromi TaxID=434347 RepID=A0ABN2DQT1_9ACTN
MCPETYVPEPRECHPHLPLLQNTGISFCYPKLMRSPELPQWVAGSRTRKGPLTQW